MTLYQDALQLIDQLSVVEKGQLLGHISLALKHDLTVEAYKHIAWDQFLDLTYGSLAHNPIERDQPVWRG